MQYLLEKKTTAQKKRVFVFASLCFHEAFEYLVCRFIIFWGGFELIYSICHIFDQLIKWPCLGLEEVYYQ